MIFEILAQNPRKNPPIQRLDETSNAKKLLTHRVVIVFVVYMLVANKLENK